MHGGKRANAGSKKGRKWPATLAKEAVRERFRQKIYAEIDELLNAQLANAKGIHYLVVRDKTTGKFLRVAEAGAKGLKPDEEIIEIWEKDPSIQAFTDLMNRAIDKPVESVEMEHSGGFTIKHEI